MEIVSVWFYGNFWEMGDVSGGEMLYPVSVLPHCCHAYTPNPNVWDLSGSDSFMFWYKEVSAALVLNTCGSLDLVQ